MNFRFLSVFTLALVLAFYISYSSIVISNSMALPYLSIQVTENKDAGTFSSLSRDFDQTIDNLNNDNSSSTTTEATNDNDNDESLQE